MAHTILGIDLGSYSVKVALLQAGFRSMHLLSLHERALLAPLPGPGSAGPAGAAPADGPAAPGGAATPDGGEAMFDRQLRTLAELVSDLGLRPEMTAVALSEETTVRVMALPLSDPRKIEQVLPFELEGQLLGELEDQVIDHTPARTGLVMPGQPEGQPGQGSLLLAAAAPKVRVAEVVARLERLGLEPRLVGVAALDGAALLASTTLPEGPAAILDLGHRTSHFCVVERRPGTDQRTTATFARTIGRGGAHLTAALSRALSIDLATAEAKKRDIGQVDPAATAAPSGSAERSAAPSSAEATRVSVALLDGIRPLLRDLRQTLASYATLYGEVPRSLLLCGGGARLRGIDRLLEAELGLTVSRLAPEQLGGAPWLREAAPAVLDRDLLSCASALGLALSVAGPVPQVNFRKGELAYRSDYSFLREKAPHLAVAVLAILLCAGLSAVASLRNLQRESDQLRTVLQRETTSLFGEPKTDGAAVSSELSSVLAGSKAGAQSVPTTSAFDLLDEISRAAPGGGAAAGTGSGSGAGGGGTLDVLELDIRPKKTDLRATAASAQYVDDLVAALSKIPCFKDIEKGKVVSVKNTGADGKPVEVKTFSLAITTTCP